MTLTDLSRLRSALTEIQCATDLAEAHAIATKALEPPPRQYAVAETLADLDPHVWRVVGRRTFRRMQWCIPLDEVAAFTERRDAGQFTSTQARQGDHFVVLARRMPSVADAAEGYLEGKELAVTKIERQTAEAVIALLEAQSYRRVWNREAILTHLATLRAALGADPEPRACDPYPVCGVDAGTRQRDVSSMQRILEDYKPADPDELACPKIFLVERGALVSIIHRSDPPQYDADPPQEPGRETPEAPK